MSVQGFNMLMQLQTDRDGLLLKFFLCCSQDRLQHWQKKIKMHFMWTTRAVTHFKRSFPCWEKGRFPSKMIYKMPKHGLCMSDVALCARFICLNISSVFLPLLSCLTHHSGLPQAAVEQILSVLCQRAARESPLGHQRPCQEPNEVTLW